MKIASSMRWMLNKLDDRFNIGENEIHLLGIAADYWVDNKSLRVTDLLEVHTRTSRATTHKAVRALVKSNLLKETQSKGDKREKFLTAGTKFAMYVKTLRGL